MTRSRKTITAIAGTVVLAAAATITVLAISGSHAPAVRPATHPSAVTAAVACSKLNASAFPPAAYDKLIIREVNRITRGGSASTGEVRTAKDTVAAEIKAACPQFTYLAHD